MKAMLLGFCGLVFAVTVALGTSNYNYGADEYVTTIKGTSPDGHYAITAHGGGDLGYDHFHIFLTNAITGRKIGPLEEITGTLDTGADAFCARWSEDSQSVLIIYRIDRHAPLKAVSYHIGNAKGYTRAESHSRHVGEHQFTAVASSHPSVSVPVTL